MQAGLNSKHNGLVQTHQDKLISTTPFISGNYTLTKKLLIIVLNTSTKEEQFKTFNVKTQHSATLVAGTG